MTYTVVPAADVDSALAAAHAAGIVHPAPRWRNDYAVALITWPDDAAPDGTMDDAAALALCATPEWTPPEPVL